MAHSGDRFTGGGLHFEALESRRMLAVGELVGTLENPGENLQFGAEAGYSISVSGDLVAVAAPGEDLFGHNNAGQVHIYDRATESLLRSIPNPSPNSSDRFGEAVALFGNTLVVGTPLDDSTGSDSGQATVFDVSTGELSFILENPSPADFDYFGAAVAIEGDTIVVTATLDDTAAMNSGAAYEFDRQTGMFVREFIRTAFNASDQFGSDVAISGNRVAISSSRTDFGAVDTGSVDLFSVDTGTFERTILNPTPSNFEFFGRSIDLSGDDLVVGVHSENVGAVNSGAAYVFDVSTGALSQTLANPTPFLADNFGFSVAIDQGTVVIGAYRDNTGANDAGSIYQFDAATGSLERALNNPAPGEFDYFGRDVSVAGNVIAAGAYTDDTFVQDAGIAYFFDAVTGAQAAPFSSPTPSSYDFFGRSVSASGALLAVGTVLDDQGAVDSGTVQLYDIHSQQLLRIIPNPNPAAGDNFGSTVSLSGDLLVVGAHRSDIGGDDSGVAYAFNAVTGDLLHTLSNPSPDVQDNFGISVAIDGSNIVIGAPGDDTIATDTGAAYLFDAGNGSLLGTLSNPSADAFDAFGSAVAVAGDLVVVGSHLDGATVSNGGAAYVFDATSSALVSTLIDPTVAAGDLFGEEVTIIGTTVAVGVPRKDVGATDAGAVYVFDALTGSLTRTVTSPLPSDGAFFGSALSSSHEFLAVGASREDELALDVGAGYLFDAVTGNFVERLVHPNPSNFDNLGFSIALGGDIVALGAPLVDGTTIDRGAVFLYSTSSNTAPSVSTGGPYLGVEGVDISFDASASSDTEDPIESLLIDWDFDYDGLTFDVDGSGAMLDVAFSDDFPSRTIAVRVTDSGGLTSIGETTLEVANSAPSIDVTEPSIAVDEGQQAANSGVFADLGDDEVTLSTDLGTVTDLGGGTWGWSWTSVDGPDDSQAVEVVATDSDGATSSTTFAVAVANVAPEVFVDETATAALIGSLATNAGSYFDPGADTIQLTASVGAISDNGDGSWSWSLDTVGLTEPQIVTITATDSDSESNFVAFDLDIGLIVANSYTVSVDEGSTAVHFGTYVVPDTGTVALTSSHGDVMDNGDGTWSWSHAVLDGPNSETVTVTADYSEGQIDTMEFDLVTTNLAPVILVDLVAIMVAEGSQALNTGTVTDAGGDILSLGASLGEITDNGDGTWSWSWDAVDGPLDTIFVAVTATDSDGDFHQAIFDLDVTNVAPFVGADFSVIEATRGLVAMNSGTLGDVGDDSLTITSSLGSVVDQGDGTWNWSWVASGAEDHVVTITVTDSDGASTATTFDVTVVPRQLPPRSIDYDDGPPDDPTPSLGLLQANLLDSMWASLGRDEDDDSPGFARKPIFPA